MNDPDVNRKGNQLSLTEISVITSRMFPEMLSQGYMRCLATLHKHLCYWWHFKLGLQRTRLCLSSSLCHSQTTFLPWHTELVKLLTATGFIFIKVTVGHSITQQEGWDALVGRTLELRFTAKLRSGAERAIYFIWSIYTIFLSITFHWERDTLECIDTRKLISFTWWWLCCYRT